MEEVSIIKDDKQIPILQLVEDDLISIVLITIERQFEGTSDVFKIMSIKI